MTHPRLPRSPHRNQAGFTLIELLVVIIILGILSAVVVFAVRGVGDKGKANAVATDARTIRTAQEAYCAKAGHYARTMGQLTGDEVADDGNKYKFLSEPSTHHRLKAPPPPGACNGTGYELIGPPEDPIVPPSDWAEAAELPTPTWIPLAIALPDGTALHILGEKSHIFDPAGGSDGKGAWRPTASQPPPGLGAGDGIFIPASEGCINCGKALVPFAPVGVGFPQQWLLYDPVTSTWSSAGNAVYDRRYGTTLALVSGSGCGTHCGKVLAAGNTSPPDILGTITRRESELFDPKALVNPWSRTGDLVTDVAGGSPIVTLQDGRVLVLGQPNDPMDPSFALAKPQIYDPQANGGVGAWTQTADTNAGSVYLHGTAAALLEDGRVLAASQTNPPVAEIYDPDFNSWTYTQHCACKGFIGLGGRTTTIRLGNGKIFVTGGFWGLDETIPTTAFLYDPASGWSRTGPLNVPRKFNSAALMRDGRVFVAGGRGEDDSALNTAELYTP